MRSFFRWLFSWKFVRNALVALAILLVLCLVAAVVTITVVNVRGGQRWREYEAAAKQRGVKLSFDDFVPPPVPDGENFAATPVFAKTVRARATGEPEPLARLEAGEYTNRPGLSLVATRVRSDLEKWVRFFNRDGKAVPKTDIPARDAALRLLEILKEFDPVLNELDAAAQRPAVRFSIDWQAGDAGAEMSHLTLLQNATVLWALRSSAYVSRGDGQSARDAMQRLLKFRRMLEREPTNIPALTRFSITANFLNCAWEGLAAGVWNDAQLSTLDVELGRIDFARDLRFLLESQRASTNRMFDIMLDRNAPGRVALERTLDEAGGFRGMSRSRLRYLPLLNGWVRGNQWRMNRFFDELLNAIDDTRGDIRPAPPHGYKLLRFASIPEAVQYLLFKTLGPVYGVIGDKYAYGETIKRQARIGCALERHRLREGTYPPSLAMLAPDFMTAVPTEALVDADFHYEVMADGAFRLYSVALNRKDDGGKSGSKSGGRTDSTRLQLDWLWSHVAEPGPLK